MRQKQTFKEFLLEVFSDLGKLSPEELTKGQRLEVEDDGNFNEVDGRVFKQALTQIRYNDIAKMDKGLPYRGLVSLSVYGVKDYNNMACYLGINNSSGYAIAGGNELVSVFSTSGSSGRAIVGDAIKNGVTHLDCFAEMNPKSGKFAGKLFGLYSSMGFKVDTNMNHGGEYPVKNGISVVYQENGEPEYSTDNPDNVNVVIYMKL